MAPVCVTLGAWPAMGDEAELQLQPYKISATTLFWRHSFAVCAVLLLQRIIRMTFLCTGHERVQWLLVPNTGSSPKPQWRLS